MYFLWKDQKNLCITQINEKKQEYRHTIVFGFPTSKSIKIQLNLTNIY